MGKIVKIVDTMKPCFFRVTQVMFEVIPWRSFLFAVVVAING